MNIKTRVQKLEQRTGVGSEVCTCFPRRNLETWRQSEIEKGVFTAPEIFGDAVPDCCDGCGKPIEKEILMLQFIKSTIPKPEGAR
jgi:hypothetical protein